MTIEEAMAQAESQIDAILEREYDESAFRLIACGVDPDLVRDMLAEQRAYFAARRLTTLDQVRATLLAF
jgi:hypothetical protein